MKRSIYFYLVSAYVFLFYLTLCPVYSQCLEEGKQFLPEPTISNNDLYGNPITGFENYFLASAPSNDQYEFDGGNVDLYRLNSGSWSKQAQLKPSEINLEMYFGRKTAMGNNIIIIAGNTFSPEGFHFDELFVYVKQDVDDWSSSTESYRVTLRNDLNTGLIIKGIVIRDDIIGVSYYTTYEDNVAFYRFNADQSMAHITTLKGPTNGSYTNDQFGLDFDFNDSFIAVTGTVHEQYTKKGVVYVYNRTNVFNGSDDQPVAVLKPALIDQQDFAVQIEMDDDYIYAANGYNYARSGEYPTEIYVFKKPELGWKDSFESAVLTTNTTYAGYNHRLEVFGDYVFLRRQRNDDRLYVYKKDGDWHNATPILILEKAKENENDHRHFARDFTVVDNYLVTNYQSNYSEAGYHNIEKLISYHAPGNAFETLAEPHQEISDEYYAASESLFGHTVSYSSNWIAIGAPGDKAAGKGVGAVYLYAKNNATNEYNSITKLTPPDGNAHDAFGFDVELSDSLLFVSSLYYDSLNADGSSFNSSIGKVYQYKFEQSRWVLKNTIYNPDFYGDKSGSNDNGIKHFGRSLSYDSGYLAVSQYYTGGSESNGAVYLFKLLENSEWQYVAKMITAEQQGGDAFGRNIILKGSFLVVGTGNPEYGYTDEMRVYIFKKNNEEWESKTEDAFLIPSSKHRNDQFGYSIDMFRDLIIVGSPNFNYDGSKPLAGRAYVFKQPEGGWEGRIEEAIILEPKNPKEEDIFGYDVHIDQNNILIGAASSINNAYSVRSSSDIPDLQPGKIYFFDPYAETDQALEKRNERYIQLSDNNRYLDGFGFDVEGAYDRVFVSALYDNNTSGFRAGAVFELKYSTFIYRVEEPVCQNGDPFYLESNRLGGYWEGEGIADSLSGLFDPSLVSQYGWTLITYVAGDCRVSSSVYIGQLPEIISKSDDMINKCEGDELNLYVEYSSSIDTSTKWYFKETDSDEFEFLYADTDSITVIRPGQYRMEISAGLCQAVTAEFNVNEYKNEMTLNQPDFIEVCSYDEAYLSLIGDQDVLSKHWYFKGTDDAEFSEIGSGNDPLLDTSGFYFARYSIESCWFASDTVEVYYNHLEIILEDPGVICSGTDFQLSATPENGTWKGNAVNSTGLISVNALSNGVHSTTYRVQRQNCEFRNSQKFEILIMDPPVIESNAVEVCSGQPVELLISNNSYNAEIHWWISGVQEPIGNSKKLATDKPGEYYAQFVKKGCSVDSDKLFLSTQRDSVFVPNVVTNNNDGFNDEFRLFNSGTNSLELTIMNRWGSILYSDRDEEIVWSVGEVPAGMYYWHIQYLDCREEAQFLKGWVHVIE